MKNRLTASELSAMAHKVRGMVSWQTSSRMSAYYGRITIAKLMEGVSRKPCSLRHSPDEIIAMAVFYRNGYLFSVSETAKALEFIAC